LYSRTVDFIVLIQDTFDLIKGTEVFFLVQQSKSLLRFMHVKICTVMSSQIIDYLLKPIDREETKKSSAKMFKESFSNNSPATAGNTNG